MNNLLAEVRAARQLPAPALAREVRRAAGVSRHRLAEELGVSEVTICRWENGQRTPRGLNRARYADLINALARELEDGAA